MTDLAPVPVGARKFTEYVPCVFLALMGALLIVDALGLHNNKTGVDPLGPRPAPMLIGILSLLLAIALTVAVAHGDKAEAEAGEDIDLDAPMDLTTVVLLIAVFAANIVLIDRLGWVISGGLLFYGCAIVLGSRHFARDVVIAAAMSLGTFYGFAIALGVNLPAGVLNGIL